MKTDARLPDTSREEFRDTVLALVATQLNIPRDDMRPERKLRDDLGADSLDMIEIAIKLEEELGVIVQPEEAAELETVGDALALAEERWSVATGGRG